MAFNVDFTEFKLTLAQIKGFLPYLNELRNVRSKYNDALKLAVSYVHRNGGQVIDDGEYLTLIVLDEKVRCRKSNSPYASSIFEFEV